MKTIKITVLLDVLMSMVGAKSYAYAIAVANTDGKTIYYNYINNRTELQVTYRDYSSYSNAYLGNMVIPESVTYVGKTYNVKSIGDRVFYGCNVLSKVTICSSVTKIVGSAFSVSHSAD